MAVFIGAELRALAQNFTPNYLYYIELKVPLVNLVIIPVQPSKVQIFVLAGARLRGPARPGGVRCQLTHGQPEAPNCLSRPTLARPQGFLADALRFLPVRGPKQGSG